MYGTIIGDMAGSPFEFANDVQPKLTALISCNSCFTDDTVMTTAVAEALMDAGDSTDPDLIRRNVIVSMQKWARRYPNAGYGGRFIEWFKSAQPHPYGSYGNGSAMRVAAVGWLYDTLEQTREIAALTAEVTHNHPEGIKGAEATASVIYLARTGATKQDIRDYVIREFGYDLSASSDEIRGGYRRYVSCQKTVPESIIAFLEGHTTEDVIRIAVSLGGDTDTLGAIAGSMAEAFYGMPQSLRAEVRERVSPDILRVLDRFDAKISLASR